MAMRSALGLLLTLAVAASCSSTSDPGPDAEQATSTTTATTTTTVSNPADGPSEPGPGGYGFDRSDPEAGIANIMDAFATDEATATCIFEAWGDVANVAPAELTPQLMTFEICGTSIFQLMTGDPRFTGADG